MASASAPLVWGYRWKREIVQAARESKRLLRASVAIPGGEPPNECNLRCIFCFTNRGKRHSEDKRITNEEIITFLSEAADFALDKDAMNYFFVSEGEPSLNKGLVNVLRETSKLGGTMTIFTNLYWLPDSLADEYSRIKNLFVCGKMYGATPETTDCLTGVAGSHEAMMANIRKLVERGLAQEGRLGVQCVVTSRNQHEIIEIFKWGREKNIVPHIMMYREQGLGANLPGLVVPISRLLAVFEECAAYDQKEFGYEWVAMPPMLGLGTCHIPGVNLYLVSSGEVQVCAGDTRVIGNHREQTVAEMMDSRLLGGLRRNFTECPWVAELRAIGELRS
jgi:MoaA/NifB/PqqE/SkfB family radical SAM enzyme